MKLKEKKLLDKSTVGSKRLSAGLKAEDMMCYPVRSTTLLSCGDRLKWSNGAMMTGKRKSKKSKENSAPVPFGPSRKSEAVSRN